MMININFNIGFAIDLDKFYEILKDIDTDTDTDTEIKYPSPSHISIYYSPSPSTIFVFKTGSITITSNNILYNISAHGFIIGLLESYKN